MTTANTTAPNLFNFATSELSQDALICWLLSWADQKHKTGDDKAKAMNKVAMQLLSLFFTRANKDLPSEIKALRVIRQLGKKGTKNNKGVRLDIVCIINDTYYVVIEDKVGTVQHSEQLTSYLNFIKNDYKQHPVSEDFIIPIYLQTHDQSCYKKALQDGFYCVIRSDLLNIFADNSTAYQHSDIYADFVDYLQSIEDAVQSFRTLPVAQWKRQSWIGFYIYLQTVMDTANWGYVANPTGGFMGLWGLSGDIADVTVYLQFEEDKICFKMYMENKDNRGQARDVLNALFVTEAPKFNLVVTKPKKFGTGKHMTFAILSTDIISKLNSKPVDLEAVDFLIVTLSVFMEHCAGKYMAMHSDNSAKTVM